MRRLFCGRRTLGRVGRVDEQQPGVPRLVLHIDIAGDEDDGRLRVLSDYLEERGDQTVVVNSRVEPRERMLKSGSTAVILTVLTPLFNGTPACMSPRRAYSLMRRIALSAFSRSVSARLGIFKSSSSRTSVEVRTIEKPGDSANAHSSRSRFQMIAFASGT